jgi:hypothetical protein
MAAVVLVCWCRLPGGGGVSCFFPRCREAGGSFCAGLRRPSWAVRGLAASHSLAFPAGCGVPPAALSRAPAQFSIAQEQEQPPSNTGNNPPGDSHKKKSNLETPCRPVAAVAVPRRLSQMILEAVAPAGPHLPGRTPAPPGLCHLSLCAGGEGPVGFLGGVVSLLPSRVRAAVVLLGAASPPGFGTSGPALPAVNRSPTPGRLPATSKAAQAHPVPQFFHLLGLQDSESLPGLGFAQVVGVADQR